MLKYFFLLLFFPFCSCTVCAQQEAKAYVLVDSTTFLIGDQVEIKMVAIVSGGNSVAFPSFDTVFAEYGQIEVLNVGDTEMTPVNKTFTFRKSVLITVWEPGSFRIPELTFSCVSDDKRVDFFSGSITLFALSSQITGDSLYIADIKGIMEEVPDLWDYIMSFISHPLFILILIILVLIACFFVFKSFMNRRKTERVISPEQIAFDRLENLSKRDFLAENDFQKFHTKISFILRSYINGRFEIAALEQPLNVFIPLLEQHALMENHIFEELTVVLQHANLIKFAKASPLNVANEKAFAFCFDLLNSVQKQLIMEAEETASA